MTEMVMKSDIWAKLGALGGLSALLVAATAFVLWITGIQIGGGISAAKLVEIQNEVAAVANQQTTNNQALVNQIEKLSNRVDTLPRSADMTSLASQMSAQVQAVQNHLSAQDGRMDGIESRQRNDEITAADQFSDLKARVKSIEDASRASLGRTR